ncbi:MAG TPA: ABC transporter substrate-binding protein [Acidimicrobiales bacterium]|jgi:peptide/nickel transport system substrate-binding protein|nr:ABC transporter substrate-binding protein [Acidimicrobiales bacterium]
MAALLLAACGSGNATSSSGSSTTAAGAKQQGGTAYMAERPSSTPDYIFPLMGTSHFSVYNISNLQYLLYRPLYFFGKGEKPVVNDSVSIGKAPTWSPDSKTVTVHLKHRMWSNGKPVTATDVKFWQNMVTAEKANWAAYVKGDYPDNVVSTTVVNPTTIQFHLNKPYSHHWFLYNELSQVTPMPQAWDVTSLGAKPGSGGCATNVSKCAAVYKFLTAQAKKGASSYAKSPLWSVVDGPWKLQALDNNGQATFVPNPKYVGPNKPSLSKFVELPFTSNSSEFNALTSGKNITVGYLPTQDAAQKSRLSSAGYHLQPWIDFGFDYYLENLNNPKVGPILKQAYVRQVLEQLVNQKGDIHAFYKGYAYPTCGPVPTKPANSYVSNYVKGCPFSYNPKKAMATLKAHGWNVTPGAVTTCANPGTGPNQCGAGIAKGAKLEFTLTYATGIHALTQSVQAYKSDASKAGVGINLHGTTFNQAIATAVACKSNQPKCNWQLVEYGGWVYAPDYYPTGGELFATGAGSNNTGYANPKMDQLIKATESPGNAQASLNAFQNYAAKQLPFIWVPTQDYQLTEVSSKLHGWTSNTYLNILPSKWYLTK